NLGTSNLSVMIGLKAALDFHNAIGPKRIYQRIHELAGRVRERVRRHSELRLAHASADGFYAGLGSFEAVKGDLKPVRQEGGKRRIRITGGPARIRISTHIFTQQTELQSFFDALERAMKGK